MAFSYSVVHQGSKPLGYAAGYSASDLTLTKSSALVLFGHSDDRLATGVTLGTGTGVLLDRIPNHVEAWLVTGITPGTGLSMAITHNNIPGNCDVVVVELGQKTSLFDTAKKPFAFASPVSTDDTLTVPANGIGFAVVRTGLQGAAATNGATIANPVSNGDLDLVVSAFGEGTHTPTFTSPGGGAIIAVTLTTAALPWTPTQLASDFVAGYRADKTSELTVNGSNGVMQWNDWSGNNRHLKAAFDLSHRAPVYEPDGLAGGKSSIFFNNSQGLWNRGIGPLASGTVIHAFVVVKHNAGAESGDRIVSLATTGNSDTSGGNTHIPILMNSGSNSVMSTYMSGSFRGTTPVPFDVGSIVSAVHQDGNSTFYSNGTVGTSVPVTYPNLAFNQVGIGSVAGQETAFYTGRVSEVVLISGVMTSEIREKVEGYLAHKWDLQGSLPTNHTYKSAAPTVPLWTPANLGTKLKSWHHAGDTASVIVNGNTVAEWRDKSGNGEHFTQTDPALQPTYVPSSGIMNGAPAISSVGSPYHLKRAATALPVEIYTVNYNNGQGFRTVFGAKKYASTGYGPDSLYFQPTDASNNSAISIYNDAGALFTASTPRVHQAPVVMAGKTTSSSLSISNYAGIPSTGTGPSGTISVVETALFAGYYNGNVGDHFIGELTEVVLTKAELTTDERDRLQGYLHWNNGLQANLPVGHPYKSAAPTLSPTPPSTGVYEATATLVGSGGVTANPTIRTILGGAASLSAVGTSTASATVNHIVNATVSGSSTSTADIGTISAVSTSNTASGSLVGSISVFSPASSLNTATGSLEASITAIRPVASELVAAGTMSANTQGSQAIDIALSASGSLVGTISNIVSVSLDATANTTCTAAVITVSIAECDAIGASAFSGTSLATIIVNAALAGTSVALLDSTSIGIQPLNASLIGSGTIDATIVNRVVSVANLDGLGTAAINAQVIIPITVVTTGQGNSSADIISIIPTSAIKASTSTLFSDTITIVHLRSEVESNSSSNLAKGTLQMIAAFEGVSDGSLSGDALIRNPFPARRPIRSSYWI